MQSMLWLCLKVTPVPHRWCWIKSLAKWTLFKLYIISAAARWTLIKLNLQIFSTNSMLRVVTDPMGDSVIIISSTFFFHSKKGCCWQVLCWFHCSSPTQKFWEAVRTYLLATPVIRDIGGCTPSNFGPSYGFCGRQGDACLQSAPGTIESRDQNFRIWT